MPAKKNAAVKGPLWDDVYQYAFIGRKVKVPTTGAEGIVALKQCTADFMPDDEDLFGIAWKTASGKYDFDNATKPENAIRWADVQYWVSDTFFVPPDWEQAPAELKHRTMALQENNWHPLPDKQLMAINHTIAHERSGAFLTELSKAPSGLKRVFRQAAQELQEARNFLSQLAAQRAQHGQHDGHPEDKQQVQNEIWLAQAAAAVRSALEAAGVTAGGGRADPANTAGAAAPASAQRQAGGSAAARKAAAAAAAPPASPAKGQAKAAAAPSASPVKGGRPARQAGKPAAAKGGNATASQAASAEETASGAAATGPSTGRGKRRQEAAAVAADVSPLPARAGSSKQAARTAPAPAAATPVASPARGTRGAAAAAAAGPEAGGSRKAARGKRKATEPAAGKQTRRRRVPAEEEERGEEEQEEQESSEESSEEEREEEEGTLEGVTGRRYPGSVTLQRGDRRYLQYKDDPTSYDGSMEWVVEAIVDEVGGPKSKPHAVLVKWKGFELDPHGWEPAGAGTDIADTKAYAKWSKNGKPGYFTDVKAGAAMVAYKKWFSSLRRA